MVRTAPGGTKQELRAAIPEDEENLVGQRKASGKEMLAVGGLGTMEKQGLRG